MGDGMQKLRIMFLTWYVIDLTHRIGLCDNPTVGSPTNRLVDEFTRRFSRE